MYFSQKHKKVEKKEDYRLELQRAIEVSHNRLIKAIDNHINATSEPINLDDLKSFPLGVWVEIGGNIKAKKRKNRFSDFLNFDIEMKAGAEFSEHFHTDIIESTEVMQGEMFDVSSGKIYKTGDVANYNEGQKHKPIATKETLLHVLFKKQK